MSKLTVKEFATINQLSVQSIYKRIKKGDLEVQEIDNIKYIIIDDLIDFEKKFNDLQLEFKALMDITISKDRLIESLNREIKLHVRLLEKPNNTEVYKVEGDLTLIKLKKKLKKIKKKEQKLKDKKKKKKKKKL